MKKGLWVYGLVMLAAVASQAGEKPGRMDPLLLRKWLAAQEKSAATLAKPALGEKVEIIASGAVSGADIASRGGSLRWQRGEFAIVSIAPERLADLAQAPGMIYLESIVNSVPMTDISIPEVGGIEARAATGLSGKNVLIGVVDSGIDWSHEDFITPDGKTRIKAILDLSQPGNYYGGTLFSAAQINAALAGGIQVSEQDYSGHGTHVAGIAAGDGSAGEGYGIFAGMAPDAELVIVKANRDPYVSEFSSGDQMLAIDFIDSIATAAALPCVINLSFGTTFGAHDGTSAVERFIDSISGPGRVVVAAAGNECGKKSHAAASLSGGSAELSFIIPAFSANPGNNNDNLILDGWYDGASQVSVTLITPANETIGPVAYGRYLAQNSTSGEVLIWNGFYDNGSNIVSGPDPYNHDKEIIIQISDGAGAIPAAGEWQLKFSGKSGDLNVWLASKSMPVQFNLGTSDGITITMPASGKSVIAVGAYTTRETWRDYDGNNLTIDTKGSIKIGDVTEFSGSGPSRDGRTKPEITAPGRIIGSTLSIGAGPLTAYSVFASSDISYPNAFILPDGRHGLSLGTSMAAPHVSGTIALLLQKYPALSAARVKQALLYSARPVTGASKAAQWGYGKLSAAAAVAVDISTLPEDPDEIPPVALDVKLPYPNPFRNSMMLEFAIPQESRDATSIEIVVYNALGEQVRTLLSGFAHAGRSSVYWDGRDTRQARVASGVYFILFSYGSRKIVHKVCFLQGI